MQNYRDELRILITDYDDINPKCEYIEQGNVKDMLDGIESSVNEICNMLSDIQGLTEIEEIKEKAKLLSRELY